MMIAMMPDVTPDTLNSLRSLTDNDRLGAAGIFPAVRTGNGYMLSLAQLKGMFTGRPAAVLGGGPSLSSDMKKLPADCIRIAVNEHPFLIGVTDPDFLVFMDDLTQHPPLLAAVCGSSGIKVSPNLEQTHVDLRGLPHAIRRSSGIVAAWLGVWLGCDPVILCGMDLYQGDKKYCHEDHSDRPIFRMPLAEHIKYWHSLPDVTHLRALSGPLVNEFGTIT